MALAMAMAMAMALACTVIFYLFSFLLLLLLYLAYSELANNINILSLSKPLLQEFLIFTKISFF